MSINSKNFAVESAAFAASVGVSYLLIKIILQRFIMWTDEDIVSQVAELRPKFDAAPIFSDEMKHLLDQYHTIERKALDGTSFDSISNPMGWFYATLAGGTIYSTRLLGK